MKYLFTAFIAFICTLVYSQDTIKYWFETYFYEPDSIEINSLQYECVNELAMADLKDKIDKSKDDDIYAMSIDQKVKIPLIKKAKKVKTINGKVYYLHIKALGVGTVNIRAKLDGVPSGATVETFYVNGAPCQTIRNFTSNSNLGKSFMSSANEIVIKITQPKGVKGIPKVEITSLENLIIKNSNTNKKRIQTMGV